MTAQIIPFPPRRDCEVLPVSDQWLVFLQLLDEAAAVGLQAFRANPEEARRLGLETVVADARAGAAFVRAQMVPLREEVAL